MNDRTKKKTNWARSTGPSKIHLNAVGYILVGGASSRFGSDKALAELAGRPMYSRLAELLKAVFLWRVYLVGNISRYGNLGMECVPDLWPGEGPLGGIATALRHAETASDADRTDHNIILSCDMPFLTTRWIEELLTHALESDVQVILPRSLHGLEPLCAVWRTDARAALEAQFHKGTRKVTEAIANLKSEVLDEAVWKRFDTGGRLFWNMNTHSDYEEAKKIVEAEQKQAGWRYKYPG
jgi:molybdopterin-guanine dinucleotide biosynthesis protein A